MSLGGNDTDYGNRPIHADVHVPYFGDDGFLHDHHIPDYCQFETMVDGNTVPGENEGLWYGSLLFMLYLYPMWMNLSNMLGFTASPVAAAEGDGVISGNG